ncbi:hypothetical protein DFH09DRAFT_1341338 [Mycena vulgaris]|nr:hypothetical protein DFH09DRAFT_1341338 [Mycena vulgaris]
MPSNEKYQSAYGNSARHIYCIPYGRLVTSLPSGNAYGDELSVLTAPRAAHVTAPALTASSSVAGFYDIIPYPIDTSAIPGSSSATDDFIDSLPQSQGAPR